MHSTLSIEKRVQKFKYFYQSNSPGDILVITRYPQLPSPGLELAGKELHEIDFNKENTAYARDVGRRIKWSVRQHAVDDDSVPTVEAGVEYGYGVMIAILSGGEVSFSGGTSWCEPVINEWSDFEELELKEESYWVQKIIEANNVLQQLNDGDFFVTPFFYPSPLDAANGLRGQKLWTDFYDEPDNVRRLLEFCVKGILRLDFILGNRVTVQPCEGRGVWGCWLPEGTIVVNGDPVDLINKDFFRQFDLPYTSKLFRGIGSGFFHHHCLGLHQVLNVADIENMCLQEIFQDPSEKPIGLAIENDKKIRDSMICASLKKPILLNALTPKEVHETLDILKEGRFILDIRCKDEEEAQNIIKEVRLFSQID